MKYHILFLLLLCSFAIAETPIYMRSDLVTLSQPCINNNTPCSSISTCNISIIFPNGSTYVDNELMTRKGVNHEYKIQFDDAGKYHYTMFCQDGQDKGHNTFDFIISSTGQEYNPTAVVIALGLICFLLVYVSQTLDNDHFVLKFFFVSTSIIIGIILIPASLLVDKTALTMYGLFPYISYVFFAYIVVFMIYFMLVRSGVIPAPKSGGTDE